MQESMHVQLMHVQLMHVQGCASHCNAMSTDTALRALDELPLCNSSNASYVRASLYLRHVMSGNQTHAGLCWVLQRGQARGEQNSPLERGTSTAPQPCASDAVISESSEPEDEDRDNQAADKQPEAADQWDDSANDELKFEVDVVDTLGTLSQTPVLAPSITAGGVDPSTGRQVSITSPAYVTGG